MKKIIVSDIIKEKAPEFKGAAISADVVNAGFCPELWIEFDKMLAEFSENMKIGDINKKEAIKATRNAYKALGKEPNRYRPSSEALSRRVLKEKSLYKINTLVDIINYVSISTGYSIGGFDEDKIVGETLILTKGEKDEVFHAIGRGLLNIENLPVYKDQESAIGSPTSDEERTKISLDTRHILIIINGYSGDRGLDEAALLICDLLEKYAGSENVTTMRF